MRYSRLAVLILLIAALASFSLVAAQEATEEPETTPEPDVTAVEVTEEPETTETAEPPTETTEDGVIYVVQRGDNLFRIALSYGLTTDELAAANGISNTSQIFVGQRLIIPVDGAGEAPAGTPQATPTPSATAILDVPTEEAEETPAAASAQTYTVQRGDTLFSIATRNNTTIDELVALNNLSNANNIFVGQELILPGFEASATIEDPGGELPDVELFYGLEVYIAGQDVNAISTQLTQLGFTWAKINVDWRNLELVQGSINFADLDTAINTLSSNGFNILLTINTAPDWARSSASQQQLGEDGPPDDFEDFAAFVSALATRYTGQVQAYQIWNEPNLRREWNSGEYPIRADHYVDLVSAAAEAIEAADPDALIVTAGLAPTGFNDGVNAIDDRVFLQDMFSNDVDEVADAIGAHPNGWANPPAAECCEQPEGVETHFDNERFYFLETLAAYRAIINRNQASTMPIWATRFGWGTSEGAIIADPSQNNIFLTYTDLEEQAAYVSDAFELGSDVGYVGAMFLNNLNGCQANDAEACYYSLIDANGAVRPSFAAVRSIGFAQAESQAAPEATAEASAMTDDADAAEATPIPDAVEDSEGATNFATLVPIPGRATTTP